MAPAPTVRTFVYVDGFNLFFGALKKRRQYRWLNLAELCRQVLQPQHHVELVRYFTARVKPTTSDPQKHVRQQMYIRALETLPNVSVHYGHFLTHPKSMALVDRGPNGETSAMVWSTQEKGSDVNLATNLLVDAFDRAFEAAVVISNDSDLAEPIAVVRKKFGLPVGIINPHPVPSIELKRVAKFCLQIEEHHLQHSQFPPQLEDSKGRVIRKPSGW